MCPIAFRMEIQPVNSIQEFFRSIEAEGAWSGCDWETEFGVTGLNLNGMKSRQCKLLANATSGTESLDWEAAEKWLRKVERAAAKAKQHAVAAVKAASNKNWDKALTSIESAVEIESQYHSPDSGELTWEPLRILIESAAS